MTEQRKTNKGRVFASRGDRHLPHPSRRGDLKQYGSPGRGSRGFPAIGLVGIEPRAGALWPIHGDRVGAWGAGLYPVSQPTRQ